MIEKKTNIINKLLIKDCPKIWGICFRNKDIEKKISRTRQD